MAGFITGKFLFGIFAFLTIQFGTCLSKMLEENLRISAFNLRMFGDARAENTDVVEILAKIIRRYDISILQEIRDKDGSAFKLLMNEINGNTDEYASDLSQRLGTSHIKEEYAVVYRKDTVRLDDTYQYPDPDYDYFERPPFSVKVHLKTADELDEMAIIAIHTKPTEAVEEIDKLVDVSKNTSDHWNGLKNILIAGDLNAGCSYVTTKEMKIISLRKDKRYSWLIGDDVDTTTSGSDCAYDRFVASGDQLKAAIVPGSAREFKFEEEYNLSEKQMKEVSDHYPIELEIRGRVNHRELAKFDSKLSMSFQDNTIHNREDVMRILNSDDFVQYGFDVSIDVNIGTEKKHITAFMDNMTKDQVLSIMHSINLSSDLIRESVCELVILHLNSPLMSGIPGGHGFLIEYDMRYAFEVSCEEDGYHRCSFKLTRGIVTIGSFA